MMTVNQELGEDLQLELDLISLMHQLGEDGIGKASTVLACRIWVHV